MSRTTSQHNSTCPAHGDEPEISDEQLARGARTGCSSCFDELVARIAPPLLRYLHLRVGDYHGAEDLLQEALLRIHGALSRYDPQRPFRPWAWTIAMRLAIDTNRRNGGAVVGAVAPGLADPRQLRPDSVLGRREQLAGLWQRAEQKLTEDQFRALYLQAIEQLSLSEIGDVLSRSPNAVKALLHRGRVRLLDAEKQATQPEVCHDMRTTDPIA